MSFLSAKPMRVSLPSPQGNRQLYPRVGAEASGSPYNVLELTEGSFSTLAIYSLKTNGFPVWAYAKQTVATSVAEGGGVWEIWLYLAQIGIPIYSVNRGKWTDVSKYVSQSAEAADATLIESVDVSKGGVLKSGNALYASDALGISEVRIRTDLWKDDWVSPMIKVKAAKGLATIEFAPHDIYDSMGVSALGFAPQETKPPVGMPPIPEPPGKLPTASATARPFPTGKWVAGGLTLGGLLWALGRRP